MKITTNKVVTSTLTLTEEETKEIFSEWLNENTNLKGGRLEIEFEIRHDMFDGITIIQTVEETEEEDG